MSGKHVTIMMIPDGTDERREIRLPMWVLRSILVMFGFILIGIVLFFIFYSTILERAAITDRVLAENEQLTRYRYKVQLLEENMNQARTILKRLTELAGVEYTFPEMPADSVLLGGATSSGPAVLSRDASLDPSVPGGLPVEGYITQYFQIADPEKYHPGIDIACAVGTPVLSTATGVVIVAAIDSVYGKMLIVQNNDSISTLYGHNDSVLVSEGDTVSIGSRVTLSGNTGVSTAPHLHYEVRINDQPINPLGQSDEEGQ